MSNEWIYNSPLGERVANLFDSVEQANNEQGLVDWVKLTGNDGDNDGWVNSVKEHLNIRQYGAKGEGLSNDTLAFQRAVAVGRGFRIPKGRYKLNGTLTPKGAITGSVNLGDYGVVADGVTNDFQALQRAIASGLSVVVPDGIYMLEGDLALAKAVDQLIYNNLKNFGAKGDGVTDDTTAIQAAFDASIGRTLYVGQGEYMVSQTIKVRENTSVECDGKYDARFANRTGVRFVTLGAGNPQVWTDRDPAGDASIAPMFVFAGDGIEWDGGYFETNLTNPWHSCIFIPANLKHTIRGISTSTSWLWGLYMDATWSDLNTTLTTLHPDIQASSLQEISIENCRLRGINPLAIRGTTRDPADTGTYPTWVWSYSGTSDIRVTNCEIRPNSAGGTALTLDARIRNSAGQGQGIWFFGNAFRCSTSETMFDFGEINRVLFVGGYGEAGTGVTAKVKISSTTGPITFLAGRYVSNRIWVDGEDTGLNLDGSNALLPNLTVMGYDGIVYGKSSILLGEGFVSLSVAGVSTVTIVNGGTGYVDGTTTITPSNGLGYGATFTPVITAGVITGVTVATAGRYFGTPTLTVTGAGTGASLTAVMGTSAPESILGSSDHPWGTISAGGLRARKAELLLRAVTQIQFAPSSSTITALLNSTGFYVKPDGTNDRLSVTDAIITAGTSLTPSTNNALSLGLSTHNWLTVRTAGVRSDGSTLDFRAGGTINFQPSSGSTRMSLTSTTFTVTPNATNARLTVTDTAVTAAAPVVLPSYTLSTLPTASSFTGGMIRVSNSTPANAMCYSDGTNWIDVRTGITVV
jgi:hypothetical protein